MRRVNAGGGWPAIAYAWRVARRSGGLWRFYRALRSKNACKTCALGMGGQRGGMVDEAGRFPEVCKKSMQAMAADMQPAIEPRFFEEHSIEALQRLTPRALEALGRLVAPLRAGPGDSHYRTIGWDEALAKCVAQLQGTEPRRQFFYVSGRSSNEAGFLLQLFARLYGTNNVNNCSYYCHQASGVGLSRALGSGTATVVLEDLRHCDLFVLIGGNPASNHPRLMRQLVELRRRGGQVLVVNPLCETGLVRFKVPSDWRSLIFGSKIASLYLQPHIGGDIALLCGMAKAVEALGAVDDAFVSAHTEGSQEVRDLVHRLTWDEIVTGCGVPRPQIERAARLYAASRNTIFGWTMGITHHLHGVDNVHAIVNLALLRGMVGRPGAGLLPIRGHSNVQGVGSVGVTPALKEAFFDRLQRQFGVRLPDDPGLDTLSCMEAMHAGDLRGGLCLGGNLFGANPDAAWAGAALSRLEQIVYLSTTLNTGHVRGLAAETLILPVLARDEEPQGTTQESMFNFVRLSSGGPRRLPGPRSEVQVITHLARAVLEDGGPVDWSRLGDHGRIREAIAKVVPGYEDIQDIDATRREFQIEGRTFHRPQFKTASGKATMVVTELPDLTHPGALRLMTLRSEGQFNTVVYEDEDLYRHQERRDVILMNRRDIERLGLSVDDRVTVRSTAGALTGIVVREFDITPGNAAMYYPEANVLVPATADPRSRTPAFKSVSVNVEKGEEGLVRGERALSP